jgi:hypothetical protein
MTRQQVVLCEYQAARQFDYLHRRMSYAITAYEYEYWWRQIEDLGAADVRGEITDRKQ